jgi:tetratricopeptide (TPR) repeat protein
MRLWLRCTACGSEREHAVGTVYYDEGTVERRERGEETPYSEYVLTRQITCPKCGAVDRHELTSDALLALTTAMMELAVRPGRRASDDPGDERIALIRFRLADGREMHPHAARAMYRAEVEREPTRVDLRVRYGNVLRFLGQRDEAVRQYETALRIDPAEVEAGLNLAILAREGGDERSARRLLARVLDLVPTSRLSPRQREEYRDFAHQALAELDGVAPSEPWRVGPGLLQPPDQASRAAIAGPQPLVRATPRVGRNDPCPCGSGKKYKKCCGR